VFDLVWGKAGERTVLLGELDIGRIAPLLDSDEVRLTGRIRLVRRAFCWYFTCLRPWEEWHATLMVQLDSPRGALLYNLSGTPKGA
jgi:plasmid rolling circle replication initiator protein Rep